MKFYELDRNLSGNATSNDIATYPFSEYLFYFFFDIVQRSHLRASYEKREITPRCAEFFTSKIGY